jgi:hypothetical protein
MYLSGGQQGLSLYIYPLSWHYYLSMMFMWLLISILENIIKYHFPSDKVDGFSRRDLSWHY